MSLRPAVRFYQHRGNRQTVAPASEPVTVAELQAHVRADSTSLPDAEAEAYISEARQEIEEITGVAMITQTWRLSMDRWPTQGEPWWDGVRQGSIAELYGNHADLELPVWPLASVSSVTVYDDDSNAQAVTVADVFDVDTHSVPGRLALQSGATWPIALRPTNAVEVVYVAGYGGAADVPSPMARAVKQMAAYLYAHRGDGCSAADAYKESGAAGVMARYIPAKI